MNIDLKNLFIGLLTNANAALYTPAATGINAKINSALAYNADTAAITIDVYVVASGGSGAAAAANQLLASKLIPAGATVNLSELRGVNIIGPGSLVAKASTTNKITLTVSGVETS